MTKKRFINLTVALFMLILTAFPTFAGEFGKTIYLPANKAWMTAGSDTRTGSKDYVFARCHSVYPVNGDTDTFSTIQCRIRDASGQTVSASSYVKLSERSSNYTKITIKNGMLNVTPVYFQFRGNASDHAYANVSFYG